ncbi:hypothetical protein KEM56_006628 [Ascosphaera pollenicola]|nr:hypothetical protein KEM56_006628 [Ascosphaera pollenicola]
MTVDYQRYLAEKVIVDKEVNKLTPHSITATYLIKGLRHGDQFTTPEEEDYQLDSFTSWMSDPPCPDPNDRIRVESVVLVREEELEAVRKQFDEIYTIFMYSIQAGSLLDLNILTDICVKSPADPLQHGKTWGMITNPYVRRRTVPSSAWQPAAHPRPDPTKQSNPASLRIKESRKAAAQEARPDLFAKKEKERPKPAWRNEPRQTSTTGNGAGETAASKKDKGDLFHAFAKSKPKRSATAPNPAAARPFSGGDAPSGNVTPDIKEDDNDIFLGDANDDDGEEPEEVFAAKSTNEAGALKTTETKRDTRRDREEKLRKMMEDDDDADGDKEMHDADLPGSEMNIDDVEPEAAEPPSAQQSNEPTESKDVQEKPAPPGRRRGRRLVTKKRTAKDAEGYLVTTEERVWESFSEDEEPPKKKAAPVNHNGGAQAGKKGGEEKAKPKPKGQGNIMSFFAKRS